MPGHAIAVSYFAAFAILAALLLEAHGHRKTAVLTTVLFLLICFPFPRS
jgi:predicted outer membrane lipoprotein